MSATIVDSIERAKWEASPTRSPFADHAALRHTASLFSQACGLRFTLVNSETGELVHGDGAALACDLASRIALIDHVATRGEPEIIEEEAPLAILAVPLQNLGCGRTIVAVAAILTQREESKRNMASAAKALGVDLERLWDWSRDQEACPSRWALRLAVATLEKMTLVENLRRKEAEVADAIAHANDIYVELGLLHQLTSCLHLANDKTHLWESAATWLIEAAPAQAIAVVLLRDATSARHGDERATRGETIIRGSVDLTPSQIARLAVALGGGAERNAVVLNRTETSLASWNWPTVREVVCAPIVHGRSVHGWLLAMNHRGVEGGGFSEFGSVESRLFQSVGTILGIHASNKRLFRRQSDLFLSAVRALSSAIDAKDRYTSGHSDRVARLAVCLGRQLGLSQHDVEAIYLGGLLHDIGKIGIDDHVLNKPGKLTRDEFAHIQRHPQLGYEILQGVSQLGDILPIVLHHHEAWDGSGYPHGLKGEETPLHARILAVADAFDAMTSDRPYRKGMPDEKVDSMLREGAGSQWDPRVVDAFFQIRGLVRAATTAGCSLGEVSIDPARWVD